MYTEYREKKNSTLHVAHANKEKPNRWSHRRQKCNTHKNFGLMWLVVMVRTTNNIWLKLRSIECFSLSSRIFLTKLSFFGFSIAYWYIIPQFILFSCFTVQINLNQFHGNGFGHIFNLLQKEKRIKENKKLKAVHEI